MTSDQQRTTLHKISISFRTARATYATSRRWMRWSGYWWRSGFRGRSSRYWAGSAGSRHDPLEGALVGRRPHQIVLVVHHPLGHGPRAGEDDPAAVGVIGGHALASQAHLEAPGLAQGGTELFDVAGAQRAGADALEGRNRRPRAARCGRRSWQRRRRRRRSRRLHRRLGGGRGRDSTMRRADRRPRRRTGRATHPPRCPVCAGKPAGRSDPADRRGRRVAEQEVVALGGVAAERPRPGGLPPPAVAVLRGQLLLARRRPAQVGRWDLQHVRQQRHRVPRRAGTLEPVIHRPLRATHHGGQPRWADPQVIQQVLQKISERGIHALKDKSLTAAL